VESSDTRQVGVGFWLYPEVKTLAINLTGFAVVLEVCDFLKPVRFFWKKQEKAHVRPLCTIFDG
jgi:hypothetical protein